MYFKNEKNSIILLIKYLKLIFLWEITDLILGINDLKIKVVIIDCYLLENDGVNICFKTLENKQMDEMN